MKIDRTYIESILQEILAGHRPKVTWREFSERAFGKKKPKAVSEELAGKRAAQLRQMAIITAGGLILAAMLFLIIIPRFVTISRYRHELTENTAMVEQLDDKLAALTLARENFESIRDEIAIIDEAIPNYSDLETVLPLIEKLVTQVYESGEPLVLTGLEVSNFPDDVPTTASLNRGLLSEKELRLAISLQGEYKAVRDFITALKAQRHNFRINRINFETDTNNSSKISVNMDVSYYYYN